MGLLLSVPKTRPLDRINHSALLSHLLTTLRLGYVLPKLIISTINKKITRSPQISPTKFGHHIKSEKGKTKDFPLKYKALAFLNSIPPKPILSKTKWARLVSVVFSCHNWRRHSFFPQALLWTALLTDFTDTTSTSSPLGIHRFLPHWGLHGLRSYSGFWSLQYIFLHRPRTLLIGLPLIHIFKSIPFPPMILPFRV